MTSIHGGWWTWRTPIHGGLLIALIHRRRWALMALAHLRWTRRTRWPAALAWHVWRTRRSSGWTRRTSLASRVNKLHEVIV